MNKFFLLCCGLLLMTSQADSGQKSALQELEGVWEGSGKQDDSSTWSIKVTISPNRYLIDYPSLKCGGALLLIKEVDNNLVFREALTYGLDGCINNGKTVLIKDADNKMRYYWYYENNGKKAAAGSLTRQTVLKKYT